MGIGWCCRYPPRVVSFGVEGIVDSQHPETSDDDFCGEHETKGADNE